ncbi:citrate transporter [Trypanosoma conorhini]|uniref:Citrate transporter n=1 Tax=Trypanosoma conorhini TaxID=83891 RepID=A0A422NPG3_9TRYP|nr:citrate transporter [Trypanosoma conorhini]RNF07387.1 citrate transporter [Trypanosoma conorhini]
MSLATDGAATLSLVSIHAFPLPKGSELLTRSKDNCHAAFWSFLAGALTGGIEAVVTYPIEYVKTHLQLQKLFHLPTASPSPHVYNGVWDCVRKTVQQHSPLGLYRGFLPVLLGSIPKQASRWGAYEWATDTAKTLASTGGVRGEEPQALSLPVVSACGFFAGCVEAVCAVGPAECVKTRMIHDSKQPFPRYLPLGTCRAVRLMVQERGIGHTFYSGVSATMLKQGMNQALRFPAQKFVMDAFCSEACIAAPHHGESGWGVARMTQLQEARRRNPLWNGLAGFVAGVASVVITQPVDVVKTHMQSGVAHNAAVNNTSSSGGGGFRTALGGAAATVTPTGHASPQRMGFGRCFRDIYRRRGIAGFYTGTIARSVHVGTHVALTFTVFPVVRRAALGSAGHKKE